MTRARVQDGEFRFSSFLAEAKFFELAEGKEVVITIDDKPTANMRRFFEGAVVPSVFYQNPHSGWENFKDAREALKLEFLGGYSKGLDGKTIRVSRSTTELSKSRFIAFLETVVRWMEENGFELPDPEDYKAWRDSAPSPGEIYPPLLRLKKRYDKAHARKQQRASANAGRRKRTRKPIKSHEPDSA